MQRFYILVLILFIFISSLDARCGQACRKRRRRNALLARIEKEKNRIADVTCYQENLVVSDICLPPSNPYSRLPRCKMSAPKYQQKPNPIVRFVLIVLFSILFLKLFIN